jgi:uncharacterized protein (TIGR02118 family)
MKSICLLSRRTDLTPQQFRDYYENTHAVLGAKHFPFTRYARNHLHASPEPTANFNCYSEFWSDDMPGIVTMMSGPIGELFAEDEARFMDRSLIRPAMATEHRLAGPNTPPLRARKFAQFLTRGASSSDAQWQDSLHQYGTQWLHSGTADITGLVIDVISPWPGVTFPFDAVVQASIGGANTSVSAPPLPDALHCAHFAWMDTIETPPETLLSNQPTGTRV